MSLQTSTIKGLRRCVTQGMKLSSAANLSDKIFSSAGDAEFLAAATSPTSIPKLNKLPEVIVTGRANVGKSTLLNAILGRSDLVHTSKKAGRTKALNFFNVGKPPGSLVLVDSPGYGMRGREEWGELFDHYIKHRRQLRRIYILMSAIHGVTEFDELMLKHLGDVLAQRTGHAVDVQPVVTKLDMLRPNEASSKIEATQAQMSRLAPSSLPAILTAVSKSQRIGIEYLRTSIADVCK